MYFNKEFVFIMYLIIILLKKRILFFTHLKNLRESINDLAM